MGAHREILQARSVAYSSCSEIFVNDSNRRPETRIYLMEQKNIDIGLKAGEPASSLAFSGLICGKTEEKVERKKDLLYALSPKRTDTSFETPGSCMVTPYRTGAMPMVFLLCVMSTNWV